MKVSQLRTIYIDCAVQPRIDVTLLRIFEGWGQGHEHAVTWLLVFGPIGRVVGGVVGQVAPRPYPESYKADGQLRPVGTRQAGIAWYDERRLRLEREYQPSHIIMGTAPQV